MVVKHDLDDIIKQYAPKSELSPEANSFIAESSKAMTMYPEEDQSLLQKIATEELSKEMQNIEDQGGDKNEVYLMPPQKFLARAVKRIAVESATNNQNETINRMKQQNLASTESSFDSPGANSDKGKITPEIFQKNRNNPAWVQKNKPAIKAAMARGMI